MALNTQGSDFMVYVQVGLVVCGLVFIGLFVSDHVQFLRWSKKTRSWAAVQGTVVTLGVTPECTVDGNGGLASSYRPYIVYRYKVGGRLFEGRRISFIDLARGSFEEASADLSPYPKGTNPLIHYNPDNPQESVLELRDDSPPLLRGAAFGVGLILIALTLPHIGQ